MATFCTVENSTLLLIEFQLREAEARLTLLQETVLAMNNEPADAIVGYWRSTLALMSKLESNIATVTAEHDAPPVTWL